MFRFGAALAGFMLGMKTGAFGAAKMDSDVFKSATILGSGMGLLFFGASSAVGERHDTTPNELAAGFAIAEFLGGLLGYGGYRLLTTTSPETMPIAEFVMNMLAGYPQSLGLIYCLIKFNDYMQAKQAVQSGKEYERQIMSKRS